MASVSLGWKPKPAPGLVLIYSQKETVRKEVLKIVQKRH